MDMDTGIAQHRKHRSRVSRTDNGTYQQALDQRQAQNITGRHPGDHRRNKDTDSGQNSGRLPDGAYGRMRGLKTAIEQNQSQRQTAQRVTDLSIHEAAQYRLTKIGRATRREEETDTDV